MKKNAEDIVPVIYELPTNYGEVMRIYNATLNKTFGKIIYKNVEIWACSYCFDLLRSGKRYGWREINAAFESVSASKYKRNQGFYSKDISRIKYAIDYEFHLKYLTCETPLAELIDKPIEIEVSPEQQAWIDKAIAGEVSVEFMIDKVGGIAERNRAEARKQNTYKNTQEYKDAVADLERVNQARNQASSNFETKPSTELFVEKTQRYTQQIA